MKEKMGYLVVYLLLTCCFDGLREVFLGGFDGAYGGFSPETKLGLWVAVVLLE